MGRTKGTAKYSYEVRIDLENLVDEIAGRLPGDTEWEFDGTELVINGDHECGCTYWYSPQTYDCPEEYDYELDGVNNVDVAQIVTDALKTNPDMDIDVKIDEESVVDTTPEYEPDYDDYDE